MSASTSSGLRTSVARSSCPGLKDRIDGTMATWASATMSFIGTGAVRAFSPLAANRAISRSRSASKPGW